MPTPRAGDMRERITVQTHTPAALRVSSVTRSGSTATVTTAAAHGYATGDYVTHAGAGEAAYNIRAKVTVTASTTYTFAVVGTPATPATGTITATYTSDAQGGVKRTWRSVVANLPAELIPIRAGERLQMAAIQATVDYRFRVRARVDVTPKMRILWTPSWPAGSALRTLEITGVAPWSDGREWALLECTGMADV